MSIWMGYLARSTGIVATILVVAALLWDSSFVTHNRDAVASRLVAGPPQLARRTRSHLLWSPHTRRLARYELGYRPDPDPRSRYSRPSLAHRMGRHRHLWPCSCCLHIVAPPSQETPLVADHPSHIGSSNRLHLPACLPNRQRRGQSCVSGRIHSCCLACELRRRCSGLHDCRWTYKQGLNRSVARFTADAHLALSLS